MMAYLQKWRPSAEKHWLHLLSGSMWSIVGIMLSRLAVSWLMPPVATMRMVLSIVAGALLALTIYKFGFSKFANKNIDRIEGYARKKVCLFAFQKWSSYPLVIFMITLGITLRQFLPIPKPWLAIMYIGIGGSLFLASFHYYAAIWHRNSSYGRIANG